MANKNRTLLTPGNIQTPKFLGYETNHTSRISSNQILQTYLYIRKKVDRKEVSRKERRTLSDIHYERIRT